MPTAGLRILGLDLSTARSGVAGPDHKARSIVPLTKGDRGRRLHEIVSRLDPYLALHIDLAVIEEPFGGPGSALVTRILGEVHGAVKVRLYEHNIPIAEVGPTGLKKFATGKGNASKTDMVDAARFENWVVENDDQADAAWLRAMGLYHYGQPTVALETFRDEACLPVKWPHLTLAAGR